MRRRWLAGTALALLLAACGGSLTGAEMAQEASRKYDQGELDEAADRYGEACEAGEASACTRLGMMYERGQGVDTDLGRAIALHEQACEQGDGRGCTQLGSSYLVGRGVRRNGKRALELFQKGCDQGHPGACTEAGLSLWRGRGVATEPARGQSFLEKSCSAGNASGCFYLGVLLRMGDHDVEPDRRRADGMLGKACELGEREACAYRDKHRDSLRRAPEPVEPPTPSGEKPKVEDDAASPE